MDAFNTIVNINLIGTFNVIRLAAACMAENNPEETGERGVIINTASIAAVTKGCSRGLCYLRRTQRISVSCLHEIYFGEEEVAPRVITITFLLVKYSLRRNPSQCFKKILRRNIFKAHSPPI